MTTKSKTINVEATIEKLLAAAMTAEANASPAQGRRMADRYLTLAAEIEGHSPRTAAEIIKQRCPAQVVYL